VKECAITLLEELNRVSDASQAATLLGLQPPLPLAVEDFSQNVAEALGVPFPHEISVQLENPSKESFDLIKQLVMNMNFPMRVPCQLLPSNVKAPSWLELNCECSCKLGDIARV
jgi:hypothetical protein